MEDWWIPLWMAFYQIAPDGYHIKLLDNISEYTKYEGEVYYYMQMNCQNNHQNILMINVEFLMNDTYKYIEKYTSSSEDKISGIKSAKWKM